MTSASIPADSLLRHWLTMMSITEVPVSYQIATCLSALGCSLRRQVYFDQLRWKVFPNLSILLVGPSGIGKDIAIDHGELIIDRLAQVPKTPGRTIEMIYQRMVEDCGDPAAAFIPAPEISAFMGKKDYQESMAQEITALLSTKDYHDISTKTSGKLRIPQPTMTMMAGSTAEWLHKAMPDGSLEGGLWPRFLIVVEGYGKKFVPMVKYDGDSDATKAAADAEREFFARAGEIVGHFQGRPREIIPLVDARYLYQSWYINRFARFSPAVAAYANRCRDQVLRVAMIMAISRRHDYMEEVDVQFGIDVMAHVAANIDAALRPPTEEARAAKVMLDMLPATKKEVVKTLSKSGFSVRTIFNAETLLRESGQIRHTPDGWEKC